MSSILKSLDGEYTFQDLTKIDLSSSIETKIEKHPTFYAYLETQNYTIVSITPIKPDPEDNSVIAVEIDYTLAVQFLTGQENITKWVSSYQNDAYRIIRLEDKVQEQALRIDALSIYEIVDEDTSYPDILIVYEEDKERILLHYNGETIESWRNPVKLYFTAEGNPSYLKCAFTLDVNIIQEITTHNKLESWPNPIILPIDGKDGISVFTIKSNLKMALKRK